MNTVAIVLALLMVTVGIIFNQRSRIVSRKSIQSSQEVLSQGEGQTEDQHQNKEAVEEVQQTPTPSPIQNELFNYQYPDSQILDSSNSYLLLGSSADSDVITDWYKDKIESEAMNVKTFVTTRANDKVLNKLVGADGNKELRVEISKDPGDSLVKISVTIKYF